MIKNSTIRKIYLLSGATTLILAILFLNSALSFISSNILAGTNCVWYSTLQNNWLIVIFKLHAGLINMQDDPLQGLNLLDIIILVAFSTTCFGMYMNLKKSSKIWSLVAFAFMWVAIILFAITQNAGRSTVMLSVLIFSLIMIKDKIYSKVTIYTGIIASIFLFVGDLSVGIHSHIITMLFGIGYILLTLWFFLIFPTLLWLGKHEKEFGMMKDGN